MVMHLPPPTACSLQLVDDIVAERQNGRNADFFTSISADWRVRVQQYLDAKGAPDTVECWPEVKDMKGSFLNLYSSPADGSVQGAILEQLRAHNLVLCPACGEAGRPNTLDHYLPKGKYPHFCVTPHNLFPMCDACQKEKLDKTGDITDPRFFVHPYFDVFVAEQVITLTIEPPFDVPTFALAPRHGLTAEQTRLISAHMRELAIPQRYGHFFRGQHRRLIRLVELMRTSGQDVSANLVAFRDSFADPSQNSWEHVFYSSVLSNDALAEYLQNGILPTLP